MNVVSQTIQVNVVAKSILIIQIYPTIDLSSRSQMHLVAN